MLSLPLGGLEISGLLATEIRGDALWTGADMIGLGVSSISHAGGLHYQNEHQFDPYVERVEKGELPIARAMDASGGWPVVALEAEVIEAHALVHAHTAIDADPTGTSGLAGLLHDRREGRTRGDETALVLITGVTRR